MFNNPFFLGVGSGGYVFLRPPQMGKLYSDDEILELAALIIAMKPQLKEKFEAISKRVEA
jgi:hypothetical protein